MKHELQIRRRIKKQQQKPHTSEKGGVKRRLQEGIRKEKTQRK